MGEDHVFHASATSSLNSLVIYVNSAGSNSAHTRAMPPLG